MPKSISEGTPLLLGATPDDHGVNFALFAEKAHPVSLCLYDPHSFKLLEEIPIPFHTGQIRHIYLQDVKLPVAYGYKISSSAVTNKVLLDPYSKALTTSSTWGDRNRPYSPLGLIMPKSTFDWGPDAPLALPREDMLIYEMHVRGFTKDRSSGVASPGTFLGMIEKIPHLKTLGINVVEIMPLQEFNENEYPPTGSNLNSLCQYWGYSTVNFFTLMNRYASSSKPGVVIDEFKTLVKALHLAGIEVILDVVFNHTAEGNSRGPLLSYKGLGNEVYYLVDSSGKYINDTGCGNTLNCNHPVVLKMILDSLRYFVTEFHIDGFRFDLASIFYRGAKGLIYNRPAVLQAINKDPILSGVKLIAEPWDAAGLFQLGNFFTESTRISEWNSYFRDDVRKFIKGDQGSKGSFATRLCGSQDLYGHASRTPCNSINFVCCHDGFTLKDLTSYNEKHNLINGENNNDGSNQNDSWNCGVEGPTDDPHVLHLRNKQMRNFHLAHMLSLGIPMILMGDEYGHTRNGNNNSWCQDNSLNWVQWDQIEKNSDFFRFFQMMTNFRQKHPTLHRKKFLNDNEITWHGTQPFHPHWEGKEPFIAFSLDSLYGAFNACSVEMEVIVPTPPDGKRWHWIANTALPSPDDFRETPVPITTNPFQYKMEAYSSLLLKALPV